MGSSNEDVLSLFYHLIREMVDHPDEVFLQRLDGGHRILCEIYVHREDVRKVIGTKGRCADALREVMGNTLGKHGQPITLDIIEPHVERPTLPRQVPNRALKSLIDPIARVAFLLKWLLKASTEVPDNVVVDLTRGSQSVLYTLEVAPRDLARTIGRRGRTIDALRDLTRVLAGRHGFTCHLDINEGRRTDIIRPKKSPSRRLP